MNSDTATLLASAQKEYEAKKQQLEQDFAKKKSDLLSKVKIELADALTKAQKVYETIPPDSRDGIFSEAAFTQILDSFGLKQGKAKKVRKGRVAAPKVTDEQILAYLDTEKKTGDVEGHFKLSAVTVGKKLGDLLKAKKVSVRKEGTAKYWGKI